VQISWKPGFPNIRGATPRVSRVSWGFGGFPNRIIQLARVCKVISDRERGGLKDISPKKNQRNEKQHIAKILREKRRPSQEDPGPW
jgi:hypothetical protein